jgi:hypothetical protein
MTKMASVIRTAMPTSAPRREDDRHRDEKQNPRQRGKADANIAAENPQANEDEREEEDASLRGEGVDQVEFERIEARQQDGIPARGQPVLHCQLRGGVGEGFVVVCDPECAASTGSHWRTENLEVSEVPEEREEEKAKEDEKDERHLHRTQVQV